MSSGPASATKRILVQGAIVAVAALMTSTSRVDGQVRLLVPDQSLGGPYYARLERGMALQTDEWVAIAFYRDPSCVRSGFNLLNFFDFTNIPAIFSCPLTVHGFELWGDPASDTGPRQSKLQGNGAVPVWFVSDEDFRSVLPGVTMAELFSMPSLMQGVATDFEETLHPTGAAKQTVLEIVARGDLPDGRTFHFVAVEATAELRYVRIEFR
jgi:hypothetical protein